VKREFHRLRYTGFLVEGIVELPISSLRRTGLDGNMRCHVTLQTEIKQQGAAEWYDVVKRPVGQHRPISVP
jgi:hypothetical protein